jgi:hypothetical protein
MATTLDCKKSILWFGDVTQSRAITWYMQSSVFDLQNWKQNKISILFYVEHFKNHQTVFPFIILVCNNGKMLTNIF